MLSFRERDIRNQVAELLEQTGAFDGVYLSGLPEDRGESAADSHAVAIEPWQTAQAQPSDDYQGDPLLSCRVNLIILARHEDPQLRDETAELLLNVAIDALGGSSLGGLVLPARTQVTSWAWQKPRAPERRISAVLELQYLGSGWNGLNTSE